MIFPHEEPTNNACKEFLIFRYFISYESFLKVVFQSVHGHFALIKVKTKNGVPLCQTFLLKHCLVRKYLSKS